MAHSNAILDDIKARGEAQRGKTPKDAVDFIYMSVDEMFDTPYREIEEIQLASVRARFETMMEKIMPLRQLAQRQGITKLDSFDDVAPLLFNPKVLKSYPLALLEANEFGKLTQWLDRLTTHDLTKADVSGVDTIDEWLDTLEAQTPMMVMHTSGTSGKISILPRSRVEMCHFAEVFLKYMDHYRGRYGADVRSLGGTVPMFLPTYRHGRHLQRPMEIVAPAICGTEDKFICAYPGKLSADLLTLGGRLAAAQAKGEAGQLSLNPALLQKRDEMIEFQRHQADYMAAYFERMLEHRGERVMFAGTWGTHLQATRAGEERGIHDLFAPDSFPVVGGGAKGEVFPDDWYERICRFYGMSDIRTNYGMVEMLGLMQQCREGNFHPWPHQIIYLLDPQTGAVRPREGVQHGRFAFMDLSAETYWGGGLSGDAVTVHWGEKACTCGRQGPFVGPTVARIADLQGGDDKISCAGAQAAHDSAMEFLAQL
jgi:hypothetical protein